MKRKADVSVSAKAKGKTAFAAEVSFEEITNLNRETDFKSEIPKGAMLRMNKLTGMDRQQILHLEFKLRMMEGEMAEAIESRASQMHRSKNDESMIKGDDAEVAEKQRTNNATLQEMDLLKHRLRMVRHALSRMSHGAYGLCEESEEPIGFERLCVVPWARFGVNIQEKRERATRDFRGHRLMV